jgi:4-amino-4-deoxy-L-arabinose transferase-like glycosyltransferase
VLLSIGYRLGVPYYIYTHFLGTMALWIAGVAAASLTRHLLPKSRWAGLVGGLAVIFAWHLIWAAASGMETMLFSMWTLLLVAIAWYELTASGVSRKYVIFRGILFGITAALATITRPEGVVLAGIIGLLMLIARPQSSWLHLTLWVLGVVIAYAVAISPYLVLNLQLTGGLLPDTAAAKQAEYAQLLEANYPFRYLNMLYPLIAGGQIFLLPGVVYFVICVADRIKQEQRNLLYLLPLLWFLALIGLYAARLPAPYQHGRYVIPALPSYIVMGVVGTIWLMQRYRRSSLIPRVVVQAITFSTIALFVIFAIGVGPSEYRQDVFVINEEMVASARWIAQNVPSEELLAVHDIGAVGYFAPRPLLDLAGLVSPEIVPFIVDEDRLWEWLRTNNARHLMGFPYHVPGGAADDPRLCLIFSSGGAMSPSIGGDTMAVYEISWDGRCSDR